MLILLATFVKVKPRSAPLAAVEDLDKETENGYAIPRDNITPGSQVRYHIVKHPGPAVEMPIRVHKT